VKCSRLSALVGARLEDVENGGRLMESLGRARKMGSQDTGVCAREKEQNRKSARLEFKDLLISVSILWTRPVPSVALALCWPLLASAAFLVLHRGPRVCAGPTIDHPNRDRPPKPNPNVTR